jgi:hypothetical protein
LETIHHTKCKPLNIVLVINKKYQLMSAKVAFNEVCHRLTNQPSLIKSDAHPVYRKVVESFFPDCQYELVGIGAIQRRCIICNFTLIYSFVCNLG